MPDFFYEQRHGRDQGRIICGIDEVGRGPLAGPVIAAAFVLPHDVPSALLAQIRDSKKMTAEKRKKIYEPLLALGTWAVAEASVAEIDQLNILWASMLAMQRAYAALIQKTGQNIDTALIDGNRIPALNGHAEAIIKGDDKSLSIAAASIIAKVYRDRVMTRLAAEFPFYGWERNAGYGTREHLDGLDRYGATHWHRSSFAPVRAVNMRVVEARPIRERA